MSSKKPEALNVDIEELMQTYHPAQQATKDYKRLNPKRTQSAAPRAQGVRNENNKGASKKRRNDVQPFAQQNQNINGHQAAQTIPQSKSVEPQLHQSKQSAATIDSRVMTSFQSIGSEPPNIMRTPAFHLPQNFELAREILSEAIKQFGSNLGVHSIDLIIRSQHKKKLSDSGSKQQVIDNDTKAYLRSLLLNFERTGGDLHRALDMELVKQRCLWLAYNHYRRNLVFKGFIGIMKNWVETKCRTISQTQGSQESGNTLQRMLKGVISCNTETMSLSSAMVYQHTQKPSILSKQPSKGQTPSNVDLNTFRMTALSEQPLEKTLMALINKQLCNQSNDHQSDAEPKRHIETHERLDTIYNEAIATNEPVIGLKESCPSSRSTFKLFQSDSKIGTITSELLEETAGALRNKTLLQKAFILLKRAKGHRIGHEYQKIRQAFAKQHYIKCLYRRSFKAIASTRNPVYDYDNHPPTMEEVVLTAMVEAPLQEVKMRPKIAVVRSLATKYKPQVQTPSVAVQSMEQNRNLQNVTCKSDANAVFDKLSSILISESQNKTHSTIKLSNQEDVRFHFRKWSMAQMSHEERAIGFNSRTLQRKVIKGFVLLVEQAYRYRNECKLRRMSLCFRELRLYALNKIRERKVGGEIERKHCFRKMRRQFKIWKISARNQIKASKSRKTLLLKKSFMRLCHFCKAQQHERQINQLVLERHRTRIIFRIFKVWNHFTSLNQKKRLAKKHAINHMKSYRTRKILKAMFNSCDIIKKLARLQKDPAASLIRRCFASWRCQVQAFTQLRAENKFGKKRLNQVLSSVFHPWLELTRNRLDLKAKFFVTRARTINIKAFEALRLNVRTTNGRRSKAKRIVHKRALNLLRVAFLQGFVQYRKQAVIFRQLNRVAGYFFMQMYQRKGLHAFKRYRQRKQTQRQVACSHNYLVACFTLATWRSNTKRATSKRLFRTSIQSKLKFAVLKSLYAYSTGRKLKQKKVEVGLHNYATRLMQTAFEHLKGNVANNKAKLMVYSNAFAFYLRQIEAKAFRMLLWYKERQRTRREIICYVRHQSQHSLLMALFWKLFNYSQIKKLHKRHLSMLQEMLQRNQSRLIQKCYNVWHEITSQRVAINQQLDAFRQMKDLARQKEILLRLQAYCQRRVNKKAVYTLAIDHFASKTSAKVFVRLVRFAAHKRADKLQIKAFQRKSREMVFRRWLYYTSVTVPLTAAATEFRLKTLWKSFERIVREKKDVRQQRRQLKDKQTSNVFDLIRQRHALRKLKLFAENRIRYNSKLPRLLRLKRFFRAWIGRLPFLKESKINLQIQKAYYLQTKGRKSFAALNLHRIRSLKSKMVITQVQTKMAQRLRSQVFQALYDSSCETKLKVAGFLHYMAPKAVNRIADYFQRWRDYQADCLLVDKASVFYRERACAKLLRKYFEEIKVFSHMRKSQLKKKQLYDQVRALSLKRQVMQCLVLVTKKMQKLNLAFTLAKRKNDHECKRRTFALLCCKASETLKLMAIEHQTLVNYKHLTMRRTLLAWRRQSLLNAKGKLVARKHSVAVQSAFLSRLQAAFFCASKLSQMCRILQGQNQQAMIRQFMPRLLEYGHFRDITKEIGTIRLRKYFLALKKQFCLRRIEAFQRRKLRALTMKKCFLMIKTYTKYMKSVGDLVDGMFNQSELKLMSLCFQGLKDNLYLGRCRKFAMGGYGLLILRKAFDGLKTNAFKSAKVKEAFKQVHLLRKKRALDVWLGEYDKRTRGQGAEYVRQFATAHQWLMAWHEYTMESKLVRAFKKKNGQRRLKMMAIRGFQQNTVMMQYQRLAMAQIRERRKFESKLEVLSMMRDAFKMSRIETSMKKFFLLQFKRRVYQAWLDVKDYKNKHRIAIVRQRTALKQNPALARPLLVLRKFLLFKAFNSIKEKTKTARYVRRTQNIWKHAFYLRHLRRSFYSLRLNAAATYQRRKSKQIKRLMIQRRWFYKLRLATQKIQIKRRLTTDAAIFRFLSLQRKAFSGWQTIVAQIKSEKIKSRYAIALYYTRMLDKAFSAIRLNANLKSRRQEYQEKDLSYLVTESSDEINSARVKLSERQRIFFQDISNQYQKMVVREQNHVKAQSQLQFAKNAALRHPQKVQRLMPEQLKEILEQSKQCKQAEISEVSGEFDIAKLTANMFKYQSKSFASTINPTMLTQMPTMGEIQTPHQLVKTPIKLNADGSGMYFYEAAEKEETDWTGIQSESNSQVVTLGNHFGARHCSADDSTKQMVSDIFINPYDNNQKNNSILMVQEPNGTVSLRLSSELRGANSENGGTIIELQNEESFLGKAQSPDAGIGAGYAVLDYDPEHDLAPTPDLAPSKLALTDKLNANLLISKPAKFNRNKNNKPYQTTTFAASEGSNGNGTFGTIKSSHYTSSAKRSGLDQNTQETLKISKPTAKLSHHIVTTKSK